MIGTPKIFCEIFLGLSHKKGVPASSKSFVQLAPVRGSDDFTH